MVIFDEAQGKVIVNLFEEIIQEYSAKQSNYEAYIKTILKQILIQAVRVYQPNYKDETATASISKIKHFENLIEEQHKNYKSVKDYADQLNITANYLNAICNKIVGRTAGELIRDRIVLEAKRLLLHQVCLFVKLPIILVMKTVLILSGFSKRCSPNARAI